MKFSLIFLFPRSTQIKLCSVLQHEKFRSLVSHCINNFGTVEGKCLLHQAENSKTHKIDFLTLSWTFLPLCSSISGDPDKSTARALLEREKFYKIRKLGLVNVIERILNLTLELILRRLADFDFFEALSKNKHFPFNVELMLLTIFSWRCDSINSSSSCRPPLEDLSSLMHSIIITRR